MNPAISAAVIGAFVADTLALGVHWVYDTRVIEEKYGRISGLIKPELMEYHKPKEKGAFTHYGDQMKLLLDSLAEKAGYDPEHFALMWTELFRNYPGYIDHASRATLSNIEKGLPLDQAGSNSADLAGASRIAPLLLCFPDDREALVQAARNQTRLTHNHPKVLACAELFAEAALSATGGTSPVEALLEMSEAPGIRDLVAGDVRDGVDSRNLDSPTAIRRFGQMCDVDAALPAAVHFIARYSNDFSTALIENTMAGGDSAARGMLIGLMLGAALGKNAIPQQWMEGMYSLEVIQTRIKQIQAG